MFDRYVQAQAKPPGRRARQVLVVVSVAVHVVGVLGLIVYSFVHVDEVPPPLLTVTFFSAAAPPPPPPPPPPAGKKKQEKKEKPKLTQPVKQQPLVQPKEPEKEEEPEEDSDDDGEEGGQEGGVKGGVKGGVAGSTGPVDQPPPPPPPQKPKNVAHEPSPDEYVSRPDPHPPEAIIMQRKGTGEAVFMAVVCVDTAGKVTNIRTLSGIPGADDAITSVMRTWRLKPQPIPICFPVRLIYTFD